MRARTAAAALAVAATLVAAGCGGDDEKKSSSTDTSTTDTTAAVPQTTSGPAATTMAPDGTPTTRSVPTEPETGNGGATAPEDQEGGAGDEVPNSTQALITGKGGKLSPRTVSVPPFIAVTVELRSGDGKAYALSGGGKSVRASATKPGTASFDGLRSGKKITLTGPQGSVTIAANAEPGP